MNKRIEIDHRPRGGFGELLISAAEALARWGNPPAFEIDERITDLATRKFLAEVADGIKGAIKELTLHGVKGGNANIISLQGRLVEIRLGPKCAGACSGQPDTVEKIKKALVTSRPMAERNMGWTIKDGDTTLGLG